MPQSANDASVKLPGYGATAIKRKDDSLSSPVTEWLAEVHGEVLHDSWASCALERLTPCYTGGDSPCRLGVRMLVFLKKVIVQLLLAGA